MVQREAAFAAVQVSGNTPSRHLGGVNACFADDSGRSVRDSLTSSV